MVEIVEPVVGLGGKKGWGFQRLDRQTFSKQDP